MAYLWAQKMSVLSLSRHVGTTPRGALPSCSGVVLNSLCTSTERARHCFPRVPASGRKMVIIQRSRSKFPSFPCRLSPVWPATMTHSHRKPFPRTRDCRAPKIVFMFGKTGKNQPYLPWTLVRHGVYWSGDSDH